MNFSTSATVHAWNPAAWLRVTGEDAANFLQGQFTNELRGLAPGGAVYGLWLTLKGKVLADSFVVRGRLAGEFWVGSYFSAAAVIQERLEAYVIADDVVIEDVTADWAGVSVMGEGAGAVFAEVAEDLAGGVVFRGRRTKGENIEWIFPVAQREAVKARVVGARELDAGAVARLRIEQGIPAVPADLGPGDLPGEGGVEAETISYTKGCYLGQEVMARLKSMGQVRRRLMRVSGALGSKVPGVLPAALFAGDRKVGELRSVAGDDASGWVGLAMLSLLHVEGVAELALAADGERNVRLIPAA